MNCPINVCGVLSEVEMEGKGRKKKRLPLNARSIYFQLTEHPYVRYVSLKDFVAVVAAAAAVVAGPHCWALTAANWMTALEVGDSDSAAD